MTRIKKRFETSYIAVLIEIRISFTGLIKL